MIFPIHENKTSEKAARFLSSTELADYCSKQYAKKIIQAKENGELWGVYFTKSGRIKATFC
jgi:hypothetical protein